MTGDTKYANDQLLAKCCLMYFICIYNLILQYLDSKRCIYFYLCTIEITLCMFTYSVVYPTTKLVYNLNYAYINFTNTLYTILYKRVINYVHKYRNVN